MCVLIFCTRFVWNISNCKMKWAEYYHKCTVHRSSCKVPLFLSGLQKLEFTRQISQVSNSFEYRSVEAELFRANGETDRQVEKHGKVNNCFPQFCDCVQKHCASAINQAVLWHCIRQADLKIPRTQEHEIPFSLWQFLSVGALNKYAVQRWGHNTTDLEREEATFVIFAPSSV